MRFAEILKKSKRKRSLSTSSIVLLLLLVSIIILHISLNWVNLNRIKNSYSFSPSGSPREEYTFDLANEQSYGFFKDIPSSAWNRLREIASSRQDHLVPGKVGSYGIGDALHHPPSSAKIPYPWFQSHYEPDFSCQFRKRVGGNGLGDGPKWICDPHRLIEISEARKRVQPNRPGCLIYSVGSAGDFSFETALQHMLGHETCEVHIFDMDDYEDKMPKNLNMHYHKWGLLHESKIDEKRGRVYKTFNQTMKELGHDNAPAIDIFKIDCEGCEHSTFQDWLDESTPMFQQILVEIHGSSADNMEKLFGGFKEAGYVKFSKEHNTQLTNLPFYEYSFLKLRKEFWTPNTHDPGIISELKGKPLK